MQERIVCQLAGAGLAESSDTVSALAAFLQLLSRWNEVHNLTAITDPEEMIQRHLVESLALGTFLRGNRIADVGSGGGLPGIPLAIAEPEREFTLIESRSKRAGFLRHVKAVLGLDNVVVEHARVEDLLTIPPFDTVLARAVAALPDLLNLTGHLFTSDTILLALTGESFVGNIAKLEGGYRARRVGEPVAKLFKGSFLIVDKNKD
jgi:16S rRNA (guanine527-N7)-methyltransferase